MKILSQCRYVFYFIVDLIHIYHFIKNYSRYLSASGGSGPLRLTLSAEGGFLSAAGGSPLISQSYIPISTKHVQNHPVTPDGLHFSPSCENFRSGEK